MTRRKITFPDCMDDEARRKRLGLPPDINKTALARTVLFDKGSTLELRERMFIANLLDPKRSKRFIGYLEAALLKRGRGKPASAAAAVKADKIAEAYFIERAILPRAKHKEEIVPSVALYFRVSPRYVDKVLKQLHPTRRAEMKALATKWGEAHAKLLATPQGIEYARRDEIWQKAPFHRIDSSQQPEKFRRAFAKWLTTPDGIEYKRLREIDTGPAQRRTKIAI